ncbi:hypothetical protein PG984_013718 [Apiospora sp. TS-2023a]
MAPVQQTFSVIPEPPSALAKGSDAANARTSKPPMTTKQAKKLYKAATKVPKLSKAEQRRQDLMEQDRIRREFEKERNQARAKTARDKKKAKEDKEKADKKRKGMPLKEVHPSQDTLARFIRPLKPPKKVEEAPKPPPSPSPPSPSPSAPDDESDDTLPLGDVPADDDNRPAKRQRLEEPVEQEIDAVPCDPSPSASSEAGIQEEAAPKLPAVEVEKAEKESPVVRPSDCAFDGIRTEDRVGKCNANESFSADDDLDDEDFSALFNDVTPDPEPVLVKAPSPRQNRPLPEPRDPSGPPELPPRSEEHVHPPANARDAIDSRNSESSSFQLLKGDFAPREPQKTDKGARNRPPTIDSTELTEPIMNLSNKGSTLQNADKSHTSSCPALDTGPKPPHSNVTANVVSNTKRPQSAGVSSRQAPVARRESTPIPQTIRQPLSTSLNAVTANHTTTPKMAPPPLPPRLQSSKSEGSGLAGNRPRLLGAAPATPNVMTNNHTPARDTAFNEHMPPSSTQLFLLDNLDDLFPSPSQEVQEIFEKPRKTRNRTETRQAPYPPPRLNPSVTAAKMRSSPVIPRVSTIRQPMPRAFPAARMMPPISPAKPKYTDRLRVPLQIHDQCNMSDGDFPFLSTQDFFMSSQDIRELEDDTSSPVKPSKPPGQVACSQPTRTTLSPKRNGSIAVTNNPDSQPTGSGAVPHAQTLDADRQMAIGVKAQLLHPFEDPISSQASSIPDTPSLPRRNTRAPQSRFMHPRAAPRSSANGVAPDEQRSSCSNPFRFKDTSHGTPRPSPGFQSAKTVSVAEPIEAAPSQTREPPRPSPKPFFTSSGTRELTFLAIERSKRTAREDLHARRKADEELAKRERSKRLKENTHNEPKVPTRENRPPSDHDIDDDDDDDDDYELDEILLASDLVKAPVSNRKADPVADSTAKPELNQTKSQFRKNPAAAMPAQRKSRSPGEKRSEPVVQSKSKSSYEKMLELAARQGNGHGQGGKRIESLSEESDKENREQEIPTASQGTDYGDATWDMTDLDLDFL